MKRTLNINTLEDRYKYTVRHLEALEAENTGLQLLESKEYGYWLNQLVQTEASILRLEYGQNP